MRVIPGDLWKLGEHYLLCGDATEEASWERLMDGEMADLLFTDPPYGVAYQARQSGASIHGDLSQAAIVGLMGEIPGRIKPGRAVYVCCSTFNTDMVKALFKIHLHRDPKYLIWDKGHFVLRRADYHSQYELIAYGWLPGGGVADRWFGDRKQRDIWQAKIPAGPSRLHPTQKPIELPMMAISNSSPKGGVVLDPFLGLGTTLMAAEKLGRRCLGMEIDHGMCDAVLNRWESETGHKTELIERFLEA